MRRRRLGRTGLEVSELGYGAWGIGGTLWIGAQDEESLRALHRAVELGVNFIDTALGYGMGHSEELVGRVVRERSETVYVATKIPPRNRVWPAARGIPVSESYPPEHIVACAEKSLRHLGLETIDLIQLHTWQDKYLEQDGWREALSGLMRAGKVRFLGISVNDHDPDSARRAVTSGVFDTAQIIYNIFDQSPERDFFPACRAHDVGVLARVPLDEGGLTGAIRPETTFPEQDFRNRYFAGERRRQVWERAQALATLLGEEAGSLAELALRFCLSHDAVSCVIPGMRRVATVEANLPLSDGRRLSAGLLARLRAHAWPRNFYEA